MSKAAALEETKCSMYSVPDSDTDDDEGEWEARVNALKALSSFLVKIGNEPSPCSLQVPSTSMGELKLGVKSRSHKPPL